MKHKIPQHTYRNETVCKQVQNTFSKTPKLEGEVGGAYNPKDFANASDYHLC